MCFVVENSKQCHINIRTMPFSKLNASSINDSLHDKKSFGPKEDFSTVYRLPLAGKLAFINTSKKRHFQVIALLAPVSFGLTLLGVLSAETSFAVCSAGVLLALKLHLLGILSTNMIGFVYISADKSTVQISYIDENGSRQDVFLPASDIIPLSETPSNSMEAFYSQVLTYSKKGPVPYYKLCLSYGQIVDKKGFSEIFGNVA